jgi:uncharacterized protein (DUF2237 family)
MAKNVLGTELKTCCMDPITGWYRDGYCNTDGDDVGQHTACVAVTAEFLEFLKSRGNDLITPKPEYQFVGLKPGDHWCVCVGSWAEAYQAGVAAPIDLEATHEYALEFVDMDALRAHALQQNLGH